MPPTTRRWPFSGSAAPWAISNRTLRPIRLERWLRRTYTRRLGNVPAICSKTSRATVSSAGVLTVRPFSTTLSGAYNPATGHAQPGKRQMDKKAAQLMQELRELQAKAAKITSEQQKIGQKIQEVVDNHQKWLEKNEESREEP